MEGLNVIIANIATIVVFSVTVYATLFRKIYDKHKIILLWSMSILIFTWGRIPLWINDIMYDVFFIILALGLIYLRKEQAEELKIYMAKKQYDRAMIWQSIKLKWQNYLSNSSTTHKQ